jgi:peptide/nickel transport system permease protein
MSHQGNRKAGSAPVASGNAGGDPRHLRRFAGDFAHRPLAMIGLVILVVAALDTLFAPLLVGRAEYIPPAYPLQAFQGWSKAHPLGTDDLGRDELARLLVGVHSSALFAGAAFVLAVVLGLVALAAVHLVGRARGQEWGRWAEIVLLPVIGVILLGIASLVASRQVPALPLSLFSVVLFYIWYGVSHPFAIWPQVSLVLVDLLVVGELARFGYLLVQRLRSRKAPQALGGTVPANQTGLSIVGPAVVVGLWIAADALLIEPPFIFYGVGLPPPPIPTLGGMILFANNFTGSQPQLALIPLTAVLVLYAALNQVGFGVLGVLRRAATN